MSSFRHVLVTTFFVILNPTADTSIGINVCNTSYFRKTYTLQQKGRTKKAFRLSINLYRL